MAHTMYGGGYIPMGSPYGYGGAGGAGGGRYNASAYGLPFPIEVVREAFMNMEGRDLISYDVMYHDYTVNLIFSDGMCRRYPMQYVQEMVYQYQKRIEERKIQREKQKAEREYVMASSNIALRNGELVTSTVTAGTATVGIDTGIINRAMDSIYKQSYPMFRTMDPAKYYGAAVTRVQKLFDCKSCKASGLEREHKLDHHGFCKKVADEFWGKVRRLYWHRYSKESLV